MPSLNPDKPQAFKPLQNQVYGSCDGQSRCLHDNVRIKRFFIHTVNTCHFLNLAQSGSMIEAFWVSLHAYLYWAFDVNFRETPDLFLGKTSHAPVRRNKGGDYNYVSDYEQITDVNYSLEMLHSFAPIKTGVETRVPS